MQLIIQGQTHGGSTKLQWLDYLLLYDILGICLRHTVVKLAGLCANRIVKQKNIRALKASCIIVIEKCPGVHPIGLGEALWQILCKVIALATYTDLRKFLVWLSCFLACVLVWRRYLWYL